MGTEPRPGKPLVFTAELAATLKALAEEAYPFEGCGVITGRQGSDGSWVSTVEKGTNLITDRRHDRYELDPRDILRAEKRARERGEEVIGFYHTHPDHPARPSQFDTDRAWPGYHYVVCGVDQGRMVQATAWQLIEGQEPPQFEEGELRVPEGGADYNPAGIVVEAE